MMQTIASVEG